MPLSARLSLLGGFRLETAEGRGIVVRTAKGRALLAYLACTQGLRASREHLALLLWSDSDSRKSRQNLRQVLLKLSQVLSAHDLRILQIEGLDVALCDQDLTIDVQTFDSLAATGSNSALLHAADLYRGEFLPGPALDAPVFEDWLQDRRIRFQITALNCLQTLFARHREAGELGAAIETAKRALDLDPCQEAVHRDLMSLYVANGQGGAALTQYRACRAILLRELDVGPDEVTEALFQRVCAEMAVRAFVPLSGRSPTCADVLNPDTPPIGRERVLGALLEAFHALDDRGAHLVDLRGEAGIGKTHLLDVFAARLARCGAPVYRVAVRRAERLLPLGLWGQIEEVLRTEIEAADPPSPYRLREGLVPHQSPPHAADMTQRPAGGNWSETFDKILATWREAAAIGPVAIILEDVQWSDGPSLRLLNRALHSLGKAPVLFVIAMRSSRARAPTQIAGVLRDLERARLVRQLDMPPLSHADSLALIERTLAESGAEELSDRRRRRILALAGGNPQVLLAGLDSTARAQPPGLPLNLLHSAHDDLARFPPPARALIHYASLMRAPIEFAVCARAAGIASSRAVEVLEAPVAVGVMRRQAESLDFVRPWFRKAVRDDLPEPRRRAMHAAIAAAFQQVYAGDLAPHCRALAYHCQVAGRPLAAAEYCMLDLEQAFARGARRGISKSLTDLEVVLREQSPGVWFEAMLWRVGTLRAAIAKADADPATALVELRGLERRRPIDGCPRNAIALFHTLSRALSVAGEDDEALRYARRALRVSSRHGGMAGPWCLAERLLFRLHLHGPAKGRLVASLEAGARRARKLGAWSELGEIAAAQAMMAGLIGDDRAADDAIATAHKAVAKHRDPRAEAALLQIEGMTRTWLGNVAEARAALDRALSLAKEDGDLIRTCVVRGLRGQANLALGYLDAARADLEQVIAMAADLATLPYLPLFHAGVSELGRRRGDSQAALRQSLQAWRLSHGQAWTRPPVLRALAGAFTLAMHPRGRRARNARSTDSGVDWVRYQETATCGALGVSTHFASWGLGESRMAAPAALTISPR